MRLFLRITAVYLALGMFFVLLFRDYPLPIIADLARSMPQSFGLFIEYGWWLLVPFAALFVVVPGEALLARVPGAIIGTFVCGVFFLTFTMVKSSMTFAVPFYAGPALAQADRWLHLGTDPWRILHLAAPWVNADAAARIYAGLWFVPAMYFPALLRLFDEDEVRIRRFVVLFAFAWIVLGNVVAIAVMSEGPVFYDRVNGGSDFAAMTAELARSGVLRSAAGQTQDFLWDMHMTGNLTAGAGISAFPSVHVAMVTVIAAYVSERVPALFIPSIIAVAVYQVLSVYLGWHYAVDGYASIIAVVVLHRWLRRRAFDLDPRPLHRREDAVVVTPGHN
jgi:PAP2 superfamily